jgi:hypothetical protein
MMVRVQQQRSVSPPLRSDLGASWQLWNAPTDLSPLTHPYIHAQTHPPPTPQATGISSRT